jgi:hypothetical protein
MHRADWPSESEVYDDSGDPKKSPRLRLTCSRIPESLVHASSSMVFSLIVVAAVILSAVAYRGWFRRCRSPRCW